MVENIKHPNGKLARLVLELEEYDYTIEHKSGQMMQHADALSRAPVNSIRISTLSWTDFEETLNLDEDILLVKRSETCERNKVVPRLRSPRKPIHIVPETETLL